MQAVCRTTMAPILLPVFLCCATPAVLRGPEGPVDNRERPSPSAALLKFPEPSGDRPLLAILIDDAGESLSQLEPFMDIPLPLSFAVLPATSHPVEVATALKAQGRDLLAHIPMEPVSADQISGRGFLMTAMSTRQLLKTLDWNLGTVPAALGVNNHMGSRFTRDGRAMTVVFDELKRRGLYFLDSRTDPATACNEAARRTRIRFMERDVFLDNDPASAAIEGMLQKALDLARTRGCAIAIGHPRAATAEVITRLARDPDRDVDVIPVTRLLGHPCLSAGP